MTSIRKPAVLAHDGLPGISQLGVCKSESTQSVSHTQRAAGERDTQRRLPLPILTAEQFRAQKRNETAIRTAEAQRRAEAFRALRAATPAEQQEHRHNARAFGAVVAMLRGQEVRS